MGPPLDGGSIGVEAGPPDGGEGGVAFDVGKVQGLSQWLRADKGVNADSRQVVSNWADQSGNKNDAFESRSDSGAGTGTGLQPTLVPVAINGLPCVHFSSQLSTASGNDLLMNPDSGTLRWGTGDYLIEVVARYDNDPSSSTAGYGALYVNIYGTPIDQTNTVGIGLYANVPPLDSGSAASTGILGYIAGQPTAISAGVGYNNNAAHTFAMQRSGTTLSVRIDGTVVAMQTVVVTDVGAGGRLGGIQNAGAQRLDGDIAEVIAVRGPIAADDLSGIEGYLHARYNLP